jgi:hypothetical protein
MTFDLTGMLHETKAARFGEYIPFVNHPILSITLFCRGTGPHWERIVEGSPFFDLIEHSPYKMAVVCRFHVDRRDLLSHPHADLMGVTHRFDYRKKYH